MPLLFSLPPLSPLSFTPEFRQKVAALPLSERQGWLQHLAERLARQARLGYHDAQILTPRTREHHELLLELAEVARSCRIELVDAVEAALGPFDPLHRRALLEVPRERFLRFVDLVRSADDTPLPLDAEGNATISAPHAYLLSFRLLELAPGDSMLELGSGSGYGAALASYIVGCDGWVVTLEIDERLHNLTVLGLKDERNVRAVFGDAVLVAADQAPVPKVSVTFAVERVPDAWLEMIPEGGRLVAPVGPRDTDQRLCLFARRGGEIIKTDHGAVRYVKNRSPLG